MNIKPRAIFDSETEGEYLLSRMDRSLVLARYALALTIILLAVTAPIEVFLAEKVDNQPAVWIIHGLCCLSMLVLTGLTFMPYFRMRVSSLITIGAVLYTLNMSFYFSYYKAFGAYNFAFAQMIGIYMFGMITPNMRTLVRCGFVIVVLPVLLALIFQMAYLLVFDVFYFMLMTITVSWVMAYLIDTNMRWSFQLGKELEKDRKLLQELAIRDPLTGCYNRRHFLETCAEEYKRANRQGHSLTILMVDIDHFKRINDQFGHAVGDEAICGVATICREEIREIDTLARFGGEEFVILLPESDAQQAEFAAERIRQRIGSTTLSWQQEERISLTVSLGIAALLESDEDLEPVMHRADIALYQAKGSGRNCVLTYNENMGGLH